MIVGTDGLDLGQKFFFIQAVGLKGGAGVIGDTQPFQAELGAGLGHGFQGILAIAGHGVVV